MNEYTYEIPLGYDEKPRTDVIVRSDGLWIPCNEANADYQAYLASLDEQQAAQAELNG